MCPSSSCAPTSGAPTFRVKRLGNLTPGLFVDVSVDDVFDQQADGFSAVVIRPDGLEKLGCPACGTWGAAAGEVLKGFRDHVRIDRDAQGGVLWQPRNVFWAVQRGVEGLERFHA